MLEQLILIIHAMAAIAIIGLIMIQQGKGADMGASFGSGASQTVLGVRGSGNMLTRSTAILAAVFFITSLTLGYYAKQHSKALDGLHDQTVIENEIEAPAAGREEIPVLNQDGTADKANQAPVTSAAPAEGRSAPVQNEEIPGK